MNLFKKLEDYFLFLYMLPIAIWLVVNDFAWLNILFSILMVFGGYIAVVKSKIVIDKYADAIDDHKFDLSGIFITVGLLIDIVIK